MDELTKEQNIQSQSFINYIWNVQMKDYLKNNLTTSKIL